MYNPQNFVVMMPDNINIFVLKKRLRELQKSENWSRLIWQNNWGFHFPPTIPSVKLFHMWNLGAYGSQDDSEYKNFGQMTLTMTKNLDIYHSHFTENKATDKHCM